MFELLSAKGGSEEILRNSLRQEIDKKFKPTSRVPVKKDKINSVSVSDKPKKQVNNDEDRNGKFRNKTVEAEVSEIDKKCWITKEKQKKSSENEKLNKFCS